MAGSLGQLILFRIIQGLAGGGLQPSSQAVLLDAFPAREAGRGDDAVRLGGPAGASRRSDARWLADGPVSVAVVFFINAPVGLLAFAGCYALLRDPEYLVKERRELRDTVGPFRLDRFVAAGHRHGLLGSDAQQGSAVGLAG